MSERINKAATAGPGQCKMSCEMVPVRFIFTENRDKYDDFGDNLNFLSDK